MEVASAGVTALTGTFGGGFNGEVGVEEDSDGFEDIGKAGEGLEQLTGKLLASLNARCEKAEGAERAQRMNAGRGAEAASPAGGETCLPIRSAEAGQNGEVDVGFADADDDGQSETGESLFDFLGDRIDAQLRLAPG